MPIPSRIHAIPVALVPFGSRRCPLLVLLRLGNQVGVVPLLVARLLVQCYLLAGRAALVCIVVARGYGGPLLPLQMPGRESVGLT